MITDPQLSELLGPLAAPEDDLALRRLQVDREKIISAMVQVSLVPEARFGLRARVALALALAASVALASLGGARWWQHRASAAASGVEVVALRGSVTGIQGLKASTLTVGATAELEPQGTLETARGAEAQLKTSGGIEIDLRENTKVSLADLHPAGATSVLRLDHGRVHCVILHQPGRTFAVETAAARVVDVGTIFDVSVEQTATGPKTVVQVEEGEVQVQFPGGQSRLTASQSWVSEAEPGKPAAGAAPPHVSVEDSPTQAAAEDPRAVQSSSHRDLVKQRPETLAAEAKLLRSGLASEQKGELQAAVSAFKTLVERYPDSQLAPDAKAALARVEGRLESRP